MRSSYTELEWNCNKIPVSKRFNDLYYSLENGFDEAKHVFLKGNNIPKRFNEGFYVAELGFGTGLNFLTTWLEWRKSGTPGRFYFTSFEAYPMKPTDVAYALSHFKKLEPFAKVLCRMWEKLLFEGSLILSDVTLTLIIGDARKTVPDWDACADCWYLDGFAPSKNPELWEIKLLQQVYNRTKAGGSASTYTAAGFVRRNLKDAGFSVQRIAGYGRKRHMTTAVKKNNF